MKNRQSNLRTAKGITLVEMMVTIAVIAVLAAIAIPAYDGYIRESHLTSMRTTIDGLRTILEDYRLENGNYGPGATGLSAINTTYGWNPSGDVSNYDYTLSVTGSSYHVWVTFSPNPSLWIRCDARFSNCCDPDTPGATAVTNACPP